MGDSLEDFGRNPALEDRAAQRMVTQLRGGPDAEQVTHQPRIQKVQLWRLDLALSQVAPVRGHPNCQEARLQNRQPGTNGVVSDPDIARQSGQANFRRGTPRGPARLRLMTGTCCLSREWVSGQSELPESWQIPYRLSIEMTIGNPAVRTNPRCCRTCRAFHRRSGCAPMRPARALLPVRIEPSISPRSSMGGTSGRGSP